MGTLITKHLAGLFNGVSQQAPTLRLETQAEEQVNGWSSLVHGLMTRPPTCFINRLSFYKNEKSLFHPISRDKDERYIVGIHDNGSITVHGLQGTTYPVEEQSNIIDYLISNEPKNDIALTTIADYTLIVNKTKTVSMQDVTELPQQVIQSASCRVAGTLSGGTYTIKVNGTTLATTYGSELQGTDYIQRPLSDIMWDLRDMVNSHPNFSATGVTEGNSFTFRRVDGFSFQVGLEGSLSQNYTGATTQSFEHDKVAYIYVAKGVAEQNYRVLIDNVQVAQYTSGATDQASTYRTEVIANSLYSQLVSAGFVCQINGSVISVRKSNGADFSFATKDSWGDVALKGFKGVAQSFNDLPAVCFDGAILQIAGKTDSTEGSYWVRYESKYIKDGEERHTTGVWKEDRNPNQAHHFDMSTMPVQLVRKQNIAKYKTSENPLGIYFALEPCLWMERKIGDENTAPEPSFVGRKINGIFLFNNRLGVISGQTVSLTKAGDYFNFFPATVTDALDDDPIDLDAPSSEVTELFHAIPSKDSLMLFGENQQFILHSGGEPLTASTATITPLLQYPCDIRVSPVLLGQMTYFVSPRGEYVSLREYFIQSDGITGDAPDVTDHVPSYIPKAHLRPQIIGVPNEDLVLLVDGTNIVYVYKFKWLGDQKTQSSWSKWVFSKKVVSIHEFGNVLYFMFEDGCFERMVLVKNTQLQHVDSLQRYPQNTFIQGDKDLTVYTENGEFIEELPSGAKMYPTPVLVGYPYSFSYTFSPMFLKVAQDGLGEVEGSTLLRRVTVFLEGDTAFSLKVHNLNTGAERLSYMYHTPEGKPQRYKRSFLLRGDSKESVVEVRSISDKPVILQSASFEILTAQRARTL